MFVLHTLHMHKVSYGSKTREIYFILKISQPVEFSTIINFVFFGQYLLFILYIYRSDYMNYLNSTINRAAT